MASNELPTLFDGDDVDVGETAPEGLDLTDEELDAIRASQRDQRTPDPDDQEVG